MFSCLLLIHGIIPEFPTRTQYISHRSVHLPASSSRKHISTGGEGEEGKKGEGEEEGGGGGDVEGRGGEGRGGGRGSG